MPFVVSEIPRSPKYLPPANGNVMFSFLLVGWLVWFGWWVQWWISWLVGWLVCLSVSDITEKGVNGFS